jgi:hypothetical protein
VIASETFSIPSWLPFLGLVPLYPASFFLFLAPGLLLACPLVRRLGWPASWLSVLATVPPAAAGALVFWAYFLHPIAGRAASAIVLLLGVACAAALVHLRRFRDVLRQQDVAYPLGLMFLLPLGYFAVFGIVSVAGGDMASNMFLANDNFIPHYFAEHLYAGTDPRQLLADWHSSDRPPLQTGLVLVQRPLAQLHGLPIVQYQMLGTIFQCTWVAAVWALGRQLGLHGRKLAVVLAFCATASFFAFHSLYVWPKLLAGTLTVVPVLVLVWPGGRTSWAAVLTAGTSAGLALLAHSGAAFALVGLALFLLRPRRFPGLDKVFAGIAACALVVAPWIAYQRCYDPPGNRLLKWHLASAVPIDNRSAWQAVREAYTALTPAEVAAHKWANVKALVGLPWLEPTYRGPGWRAAWKSGEYYNLLKTLGVLNVGWLVLAVPWLRRQPDPSLAEARTLLALALAGLAVWILLMFGPGATMIYQGAFATVIMLFVALATAVATLPRRAIVALFVLHVLDLIVIWLIP